MLPFNTRLSADCTRSVDAALQQLQKLKAVPSKLPKRQVGHLKGYMNHVLRPCWKSNHSEWCEEMYRRQRPNLVENRDAVCAAVTALEFR
ncbi:hypothetical protein WJX82_001869 [Trebouxia sp. C0006]